jgi:CRISPR/Cas system Type II protein with McrA/HNH and RuvC-like nuclease domain
MKKPVDDALVAECAKRIRSGGPVGAVFPYPLSQCGFTEAQKLVIKEARKAREKLLKKSKTQPPAKASALKPAMSPTAPAAKTQTLKKLEKMFYLQHEKCFFCGEKLALAEANIEHLHPLSLGGKRSADNEVVCHKTLNDTFGDMPLKQKFEFVLKAAGSFRCPKK